LRQPYPGSQRGNRRVIQSRSPSACAPAPELATRQRPEPARDHHARRPVLL